MRLSSFGKSYSLSWPVAGVSLLLAISVLATGRCSQDEPASLNTVPELPLLTACERKLHDISKELKLPEQALAADLPQLVDVAWINDSTLLARAEIPGYGEVKEAPKYIWPLNGVPLRTTELARQKSKAGDVVLFVHDVTDSQRWTIRLVFNHMETVATMPFDPAQHTSQESSLPAQTLIPDFGVPRSEGDPGHREDILFYNSRAEAILHIQCPPNLYVCNPSQYYIGRESNQWTVAVATVATLPEATIAAFSGSVATDISVLSVDQDKGTAKGTIRHAQTFPKGSALLATVGGTLEPLKKTKYQYRSSLDHPGWSRQMRRWLFRKIESYDVPGQPPEKAEFAELWSISPDGQERRLLDVQGWFEGPPSHQYAFFVRGKDQVEEQFRKFESWGAYREMIPSMAPDGHRVAYIKGNSIYVREVS